MRWSCVFIVAAVLTTAWPAFAETNTWLKLDGVQGESIVRPGWIEVDSFQWGSARGVVAPTSGASGRESGAPGVQEVVIRKNTDSASPSLAKCMATGCHYREAMLDVRKPGGIALVQYTFADAWISSYHAGGGADRGPPIETFTLNFSKVSVEGESPPQPPASGREVTPRQQIYPH
jgi:type VI protein secretion system component Hcp